jgi:hypothetical protein
LKVIITSIEVSDLARVYDHMFPPYGKDYIGLNQLSRDNSTNKSVTF